MSTVTYVRGTGFNNRIHVLVDGQPAHKSFPSEWAPLTMPAPSWGSKLALYFCQECRKQVADFETLYQTHRRFRHDGLEIYDRVEDVRPGCYEDWYGGQWLCTEPGQLHKVGKESSSRYFSEIAPFLRTGDLPDLSNPKTTWAVGTSRARPVAWMSLQHVRNALALCERMGWTLECLPALQAREHLLMWGTPEPENG